MKSPMPMHLDHDRRRDGNTDHVKPYKSSGMINEKP
jgi:hypothetical protein